MCIQNLAYNLYLLSVNLAKQSGLRVTFYLVVILGFQAWQRAFQVILKSLRKWGWGRSQVIKFAARGRYSEHQKMIVN